MVRSYKFLIISLLREDPDHYQSKTNTQTYQLPIDKIAFFKLCYSRLCIYSQISIGKRHPQSTIEIDGVDVPSVNLIGNVIAELQTPTTINTTFSFSKFYTEFRIRETVCYELQEKLCL